MNRTVVWIMLAISLAFVVIGVAMIASGQTQGWLTVLFFGVCAAVSVAELRPSLLMSERRELGDLAAAFPGPLTLHASRRRFLFLAVTSLGFAVATGWTLWGEAVGLSRQLLLWPGLALFGLGAVLMLMLAIKGATLRLDRDGFTAAQFRRRHSAAWRDVGEFVSVAVPPAGTRMVAYDHAPAETTKLGRINRELIGRNAALSDSYGLSTDELSMLLNVWRSQALALEELA